MKRRILKGVEIPICICISYTVLSVANSIIGVLAGKEAVSNWNAIFMLLWTSIAVLILSIHHLFDELPPLLMLVIQYAIAMTLVLLTVYISGFFEAVGKSSYKDAIVSFTVPYIIGAAVYYISVFRTAKRQDALIQEINAKQEGKSPQ